MALAIEVVGLDEHGVKLLSPTRPDFDELARPMIGERIADIGLQLKPMLVIVSNQSPHTIVSLSLIWHTSNGHGYQDRMWQHTSFPEVVCGDVPYARHERGLRPGAQRVEAQGLVIHQWGAGNDEYYDQFLPQFVDERSELLRDATRLRIELNAVIFEDGTLVGADDNSALSDLFSAYVRAKQECYRAITATLSAGGSVEQAIASANALIPPPAPDGWMTQAELWPQQAAAEAYTWLCNPANDEDASRLVERVRLEPFTIRRR